METMIIPGACVADLRLGGRKGILVSRLHHALPSGLYPYLLHTHSCSLSQFVLRQQNLQPGPGVLQRQCSKGKTRRAGLRRCSQGTCFWLLTAGILSVPKLFSAHSASAARYVCLIAEAIIWTNWASQICSDSGRHTEQGEKSQSTWDFKDVNWAVNTVLGCRTTTAFRCGKGPLQLGSMGPLLRPARQLD